MKLRYPLTQEEASYMRLRKRQNLARAQVNQNENLVLAVLENTEFKWSRQATWGYRLFDFWCSEAGVAIEVDGPEHHSGRDRYRDEYNFRKSGVVVLRVKNGIPDDITKALKIMRLLPPWEHRKSALLISGRPKAKRGPLIKLPANIRILDEYLLAVEQHGAPLEVIHKYMIMAGIGVEQKDLLS